MANNNSSTPTVNPNAVYEFSRQSGTVVPISLPGTAPTAHQLVQGIQGVKTDVAIPGGSVLTGAEGGLHAGHQPSLGVAARVVGGVVIVNDMNNVTQHLTQGRLYEAAVEAGGGAGHFAGGLAGAELGAALWPAVLGGPIVGATLVGTAGALGLGAVGKDMVRVFTAPRLPDDADLTPAVTIGSNQYVFVRDRESGRAYWYEKYAPDPDAPDVYSSDVPLPAPDPTYSLALSPKLAGPLTDTLLKARLSSEQYSQYQTQREAIQGYHESAAAGYRQDRDGTWVRVVLSGDPLDASGFRIESVTDPDALARLNFQKQTNDDLERARMAQDQFASGLSGATAQMAAQYSPNTELDSSPHADNGPLDTANPEAQSGIGEIVTNVGNRLLNLLIPKAEGADVPPPTAENAPAVDDLNPAPRPFTPLPSYTGDQPTLTIQSGYTVGAVAQMLDMTPGEYSAYLRTVYGPDANLNDLLPGRTLPVPPEVVERLPQFNTLTEVPSGDAQPNSPQLANAADPLLPSPEGFGSPAYSFNKPVNDEALTQQRWSTANSYAQGAQSALSFIQAIEQGNEFSAVLSGTSMLNAFARASGVKPEALPIDQTYATGLGAISAGLNLRDALKTHDELGALAAGTNLSSQATFVYASYAESVAAETLAKNLGTAAGVFGIANSLKNGDEAGAAISALIAFGGPAGALVGTVLAIGRALFGSKKREPDIEGQASIEWTADGHLTVTTHMDQRGGGAPATNMLRSVLESLNSYLSSNTDTHGDPQFALIPQRLPRVRFHQGKNADPEFVLQTLSDDGTHYNSRHYNGQGQRIGLDGNIESTFAEDFLDEVIGHNAIVPKWEADTVRQRMDHGDSEAWKDETLPIPDEVKSGLMALTFHIPGASSEGAGTLARFDLDGDNYLDPVDWTGPYQAFLVMDRDGNGVIDSSRELLTTHASASHRTASLDWLDANNDGILNADDPAFGALRLWLDVNSNAHTETANAPSLARGPRLDPIGDDGELASLSQLGITAIDFNQSPPVIVDAEGNTQPLTPKHLIPKGEGARIATSEAGTDIQLADGYKASYLRAGDTRIQSAPPSLKNPPTGHPWPAALGSVQSPTVQQELARHTSNMSREAQGLFGGNAALLTGLAVAQTAAAGQIPLAA